MTEPTDDWTLGEVKTWIAEQVNNGEMIDCPACTRRVKHYPRILNHVHVRGLSAMKKHYGVGVYVHVPTMLTTYLPDFAHQGGQFTNARYWGLIVEEGGKREDGGRRGFWKMTTKGDLWISGKISLPKYANTFKGQLLSKTGPPWHRQDAAGKKFDLGELLG